MTEGMHHIEQHFDLQKDLPDWFLLRVKHVSDDMMKILAADFKQVAYAVMICEDTFVFETSEEAAQAHQKFEVEGNIQGWWYGREEFFNVAWPKYVEDNKKFDHVPCYTELTLKNPFGFKNWLIDLKLSLDNNKSAFIEAFNKQEHLEEFEKINGTIFDANDEYFNNLIDICENYHRIRLSQETKNEP